MTSGATVTTYLPFVTRNDCLHSLYDDFSDPSSGWYDGDTWWGEAGYFGGRYRIKVSEPDWLVVISFLEWMVPDEATIKVEAQSYFDTEFGLVFGYHPDSYGEMAGWYTFMIYPAEQWYELYYWRGNTGDQTLMAESTAIRQDYWPQTLEVRRSGSTYRLFINDVALRPYTADPDPFPGLGQVGVAFCRCLGPDRDTMTILRSALRAVSSLP